MFRGKTRCNEWISNCRSNAAKDLSTCLLYPRVTAVTRQNGQRSFLRRLSKFNVAIVVFDFSSKNNCENKKKTHLFLRTLEFCPYSYTNSLSISHQRKRTLVPPVPKLTTTIHHLQRIIFYGSRMTSAASTAFFPVRFCLRFRPFQLSEYICLDRF